MTSSQHPSSVGFDWSVDGMLHAYTQLLVASVRSNTLLPCMLAMDEQPQPQLRAMQGPGPHVAAAAARLIQHQRPLWACLLADVWLAQGTPGLLPQRGDAERAVAEGAPGAREALVATWVAQGVGPVVVVQPYVRHPSGVQLMDDERLDSRYLPDGYYGGDATTMLDAAMQAGAA